MMPEQPRQAVPITTDDFLLMIGQLYAESWKLRRVLDAHLGSLSVPDNKQDNGLVSSLHERIK